MAELRIPLSYRPLPQQEAFHKSKALFRGFGGAMGGGKTRALCEEVFDTMLDHPGIFIAVVRQKHTAIVDTTRRSFFDQVLPAELRTRKDLVRVKQSQGEDFCELWNGSKVGFYGLDDPGKFFSAEFGMACFDEAHEIQLKDVITVNTRLRQKCPDCQKQAATYLDPENAPDCDHFPHSVVMTFNPSFPGHWLQQIYILGATHTEWGYRKDDLILPGADEPIGDCEFFISRATDNKYLSEKYVKKNLGGMTTMERRRYLDGLWEHVDGSSFFDADALAALSAAAMENAPIIVGEPAGNPVGNVEDDKPRIVERRTGRLECWKAPVRWHIDSNGDEVKAHRYVVAVDASSGASADYSAIQVISVEDLEQVAEWQGKIDPDRLAEMAFLIGCVYNGALMVPEVTGGWGHAVGVRLRKLIGGYQGPAHTKPRIYTRRDRTHLSERLSDLIGWDTQTKTRGEMLDTLEEALRDGSAVVHGQRTLAELAAFAFGDPSPTTGDYRSPRARQGAHDDLVVALAIGVTVATRLPRQLRRGIYTSRPQEKPEFSATGF